MKQSSTSQYRREEFASPLNMDPQYSVFNYADFSRANNQLGKALSSGRQSLSKHQICTTTNATSRPKEKEAE